MTEHTQRPTRIEAIVSGVIGGSVEGTVGWLITHWTDLNLPLSLVIALPCAAGSVWITWRILKRLSREMANKPAVGRQEQISHPSTTLITSVNDELVGVLNEMGITGCTSQLSSSKYEPLQCMKQAQKSLSFMGILGSKWVIEPATRSEFSKFLTRIQHHGGHIHFLLIQPNGVSFSKLKILREGAISHESLDHFRNLMKTYSCLQVRLYDLLPCFRLVFLDERIAAVSRYKIDKEGYFQSKQGWDAPHIEIDSTAVWSMYQAFELYFQQVWDSSQKLRTNKK